MLEKKSEIPHLPLNVARYKRDLKVMASIEVQYIFSLNQSTTNPVTFGESKIR